MNVMTLKDRIYEPKKQIPEERKVFKNADIKKIAVPLFLEQLLVMLVGVMDTFMVSYAGEAAVSGVSLVNQFNTIFIYIFTALASGGAVVISQYIGSKDENNSIRSASQLLTSSTLVSIAIMALVLIGNRTMLGWIFGTVEADVMDACVIYLEISAYTYPFLAIYNTGSSILRSLGDTKTTMYISIGANMINIIGNYIGVFLLHAGVAGVAYPTLLSRVFSAIVVTILIQMRKSKTIHYSLKDVLTWDGTMQMRILKIAIPNSVENGIFQMIKVVLSSIVALFGTYQIAANGTAQSIWSLAALVSQAMGPVYIVIIGQTMGAGDDEAAEYYFRKLLRISIFYAVLWNALILAITPALMQIYALSEETVNLVILLVLIHNIFNGLALSTNLTSNGLRAAGDVKFTMTASIVSTIGVRLVFSYLLGVTFHMGVIGIAIAMCLDWVIKGILYQLRFHSMKWKEFKVI